MFRACGDDGACDGEPGAVFQGFASDPRMRRAVDLWGVLDLPIPHGAQSTRHMNSAAATGASLDRPQLENHVSFFGAGRVVVRLELSGGDGGCRSAADAEPLGDGANRQLVFFQQVLSGFDHGVVQHANSSRRPDYVLREIMKNGRL
ncbi:MAG: hypothetical protein QM775_01940 [Pirellulales bacterium]